MIPLGNRGIADLTFLFVSSFPKKNRSKTIPLSSLLIAPGKAAWVLYIDVVCINYDGNAFDAAVLAVMAALRNSAFSMISSFSFPFFLPFPTQGSLIRKIEN